MARLKPSLICVVLMVFLRSTQAQQGPLANISVAEAATAAANARHWLQMQNAGRTAGSGCSGDKCVEACGEDWVKNGDRCYFWGTDKKNWTEAEDFCQSEGGHLASVTSNATRDFVLEGMNRTGLNYVWIGGNDIEQEGTWKWTDCSPWGTTFWAPSQTAPKEPSNGQGGENCLHQILKWTLSGSKGYNHKWNDRPCSWEIGFVCGKKICSGGSVPKHTTENAAVKTENADRKLFATCDNKMKVYFDGELQEQDDAMGVWEKTSELTIPAGTRVVAIECEDLGAQEGILASTDDGLVTNSVWQCSDQLVEGWTLPGFAPPPDTFSSPNLLGSNGVAPWGVRPGIVEDAEWIWPQGSSTWAACRIQLSTTTTTEGASVLEQPIDKDSGGKMTGDSMMWKPASGFLISTILLLLFLF